MKISYDPEVDVLDSDGNVVAIEVLNASERVENPLEYAATS